MIFYKPEFFGRDRTDAYTVLRKHLIKTVGIFIILENTESQRKIVSFLDIRHHMLAYVIGIESHCEISYRVAEIEKSVIVDLFRRSDQNSELFPVFINFFI